MSQDTFANDPHAANNLRQQLAIAEAERRRRQMRLLKSVNSIPQADDQAHAAAIASASACPSEGAASARRVNEALRPKAPNSAPSLTAADPYKLGDGGIPVLRCVGSRFEARVSEPVPFTTPKRHSQALRAQLQARQQQARRQSLPARLQRFAKRYLMTGMRLELLATVAVYLAAVVAIAAFWMQHRAGG